ncbi:MAG: hypothetical protein L6Q98_23705 [Anaerolineae bacterium]|nr:hypothetical protein [Anaerolineae bacterium]NUQ06774.1 hypothetical protein [Anaerolineae bacterium]
MTRRQVRLRRRRVLLSAAVLVGAALLTALALIQSQAAGRMALPHRFELSPNTLRFEYPQDWQYSILETNLIFLASPEVLRQEPGASLIIQRSQRLMVETDTLEAALETYLRRGPLLNEGRWTITEAVQPAQIGGRAALRVVLEGREREAAAMMVSTITAARADNGTIYVLASSAPLDQKAALQPTLDAIVASVTILE